MESVFCYFKGCQKCGGDLVFDEGDWKCWQCGHYYYARAAGPIPEPDATSLDESVIPSDLEDGAQVSSRRGRRRGYGARGERNINAVIRAKEASDEKWWARNREIIEQLDRGLSVRDIARLVGLGERQIRVVRERLADLRSAAREADEMTS